MERFSRIERFIGKEKLGQLKNSYVAIIGVGAVGSYATEALARSGVGKFLLIDFDTIHHSNINRQLYALESTLGQPKVAVAKQRILDINPQCTVTTQEAFLDSENRAIFLNPKPDLLIDAIDSLGPKIALLTYCRENNIPVISSMGAALRSDPTMIKSGDLSAVTGCPLGKQVKRRLRQNGVTTGITCVYSTEKVTFDYTLEPEHKEEPGLDRGRQRKILGSLPTLTGIFGLTIANEGLKQLTS